MKLNLSFLKSTTFWQEAIIILLGIVAGAASIYYFLLPSKLILGSMSGVAIVLNTLLEGIGITVKVSNIVTLFNIVLLALAYFLLGPEVGLKTIIVSLFIGPCMNLLEVVLPYEKLISEGQTSIMGDPVMDMMAYVLLLGASQACLFRINASTGGLDIVALIMQKYLHMDLGTAVTVAGAAVCCTAGFIHPFRMVIFGVIWTWVNGLLVDFFTSSLNRRKRVCVISSEHEKIRWFIINELSRGCSLYPVKGGYSLNDGVEIQALLTQSEFAKLMDYMRKNNITAFTTAGNCSEIYGTWRGRKSLV